MLSVLSDLVRLFEMHGLQFMSKLEELTAFSIRMLEAVIEAEYAERRSPSKTQRSKLRGCPRIGLGVTGFADYLIEKEVVYGSAESIKIAEDIGRSMAKVSYETSYQLAKIKGDFLSYDKKKYMKSQYIQFLLKEEVIASTVLNHQRHMCKLSIAPTGTLSIIANCGGSGVEPIFSKYMVRRERATTGDWREWFVFNQAVIRYLKKQGKEVNKENADALQQDFWVTAQTVNYAAQINIVSAFQKYVDQGISMTCNLPRNATVDDIKALYEYAWFKELKGTTIHREGCRQEAVLITEDNYKETQKYKKRLLPKRPKVLVGKVFRQDSNTCIIGFDDGKPYEIFGGDVKNHFADGDIVKVKTSLYELHGVNLLSVFKDPTICAVTRLTSLSLRHAVPLQFVVEQLKKQSRVTDITMFFARVLSKYLVNEEVLSNHRCNSCDSDRLKYESGCVVCIDCGWSACS